MRRSSHSAPCIRRQSDAGQAGATAIEYALIVAAIAALLVLVVAVLGNQSQGLLCQGSSALARAGAEANEHCD